MDICVLFLLPTLIAASCKSVPPLIKGGIIPIALGFWIVLNCLLLVLNVFDPLLRRLTDRPPCLPAGRLEKMGTN